MSCKLRRSHTENRKWHFRSDQLHLCRWPHLGHSDGNQHHVTELTSYGSTRTIHFYYITNVNSAFVFDRWRIKDFGNGWHLRRVVQDVVNTLKMVSTFFLGSLNRYDFKCQLSEIQLWVMRIQLSNEKFWVSWIYRMGDISAGWSWMWWTPWRWSRYFL